MLKARRDAYDGRGNYVIHEKDDIDKALKYFQDKPTMLEKFVDFKMEVSVISARNTIGEICTYPVVENIHKESILNMTIAPARISQELSKHAEDMAHKTMSVLKGAGVFGIEMFVTKDDNILINEIAPRVHNSGHHTLQSSDTSQFEQHLRAILGLKLHSTTLRHPTIMYNLLGPKEFTGTYQINDAKNEPNVHLKMYGKKESRPQRKLGHFNLVADNPNQTIESLLEKINKLKDVIKITPY
jgi:5-(carboxyamino)imidazole ribonucleotide synthase